MARLTLGRLAVTVTVALVSVLAPVAGAQTVTLAPHSEENSVFSGSLAPAPGPDLQAGRIGSSTIAATVDFCSRDRYGFVQALCRLDVVHASLVLIPTPASPMAFTLSGAGDDAASGLPTVTTTRHQAPYACCGALSFDVTGWDPFQGFRVTSSDAPPLHIASTASDPSLAPRLVLQRCRPTTPATAGQCLRRARLRVRPWYPRALPRRFAVHGGSFEIGWGGTYSVSFGTGSGRGAFWWRLTRLPYSPVSATLRGASLHRIGRWRVYERCASGAYAVWHDQHYTYGVEMLNVHAPRSCLAGLHAIIAALAPL